VVRNSQVHPIDGPAVAPAPAAPELIKTAASASSTAAPALIKARVVAPTADMAAVPKPSAHSKVLAGSGASDCLSVDTDGASLGFRNHCAFGVQFAYCLQRNTDPAANCGIGSKNGAVEPNGFAALLLDTNIKSADAEHDFRWVACSGETGDVVARLDRSDPPEGRCVRAGTL
jgi:hypothetical protein